MGDPHEGPPAPVAKHSTVPHWRCVLLEREEKPVLRIRWRAGGRRRGVFARDPQGVRKARITWGSVMAAMIFILPEQRGQTSTSTANVRRMSSAQGR